MKMIKPKLVSVAVLLLAAATGYNMYTLHALAGPTQFPGSTLFSITAQYQFGASPQGSVATPGSTIPFNLTIQSYSASGQTIAITFTATNAQSWTVSQSCTAATYPSGGSVPGTYTMTIQSTSTVAPSNYVPVIGGSCDGSTHTLNNSVLVSTVPGKNVYTGHIDVAATAPAGDSFSLNWFGAPQ